MRWMDHPADLQLKECWLVASGREPVLLVQGGKAQGAGVAVLEGPPSSHGRKVWRFRFTYTVPEGGHIPFSAILKCKAGLQVSVTPSPPRDPHRQWQPDGFVTRCWVMEPIQEQHSLVSKEPGGPHLSHPAGVHIFPLSPQPPPPQNDTIFEKVLEVTVKDAWRPVNCEFRAREVVRMEKGVGKGSSQCGSADGFILPQTVGWGWLLSWASPLAPSSSGHSSLPASGTSTHTPVSIHHPWRPLLWDGGATCVSFTGLPILPSWPKFPGEPETRLLHCPQLYSPGNSKGE